MGCLPGYRELEKGCARYRISLAQVSLADDAHDRQSGGQYLNSILAVRDAVSRGLMKHCCWTQMVTSPKGQVRIFLSCAIGHLVTNDERHSILLGITREVVMQIARDLGYRVETRALRLDDLLNADEAFFTGTAAELRPSVS